MQTKKLITPQLTQPDIDAITAPITGEVIFNTTLGELVFFNGSIWQSVVDAGGTSDDKLFRINASDSVSGYHEDKIIDSDSIFWTTEGATNKTRKAEIDPNYNFEFDGDISFNGSISFGAAVSVNINANTDNLLIPNLGSSLLVRLNFTGNYSITGIVPNDITKGQWIIVNNVGTGSAIFKDNDAGSTAQNRFIIGANKTVQTDEGLAFVYDTVDQRWRSFAINI